MTLVEQALRRLLRPPLEKAGPRWGDRRLISDDAAQNNRGTNRRVVLVDTKDLGMPEAINIQIRFAANNAANNQPVEPFTYPAPGAVSLVRITIRRGIDDQAGLTEDVFNLTVNDVLPIDIVTCRWLTVTAEVTGFGSGTTVWVEAIATPVHHIGPKNEAHPWDVSGNPDFKAASAAAITLLGANSDRVQFFVVNTSTDADLLIQLGKGPNGLSPVFGATPKGTFILPRNMFAVYESPCPCGFKGAVFGIWSGAGTGGAIIHEGTAF
jgi:hypothetical protein